jgi:glycosyltransferase involved in cell wall biosynthesis
VEHPEERSRFRAELHGPRSLGIEPERHPPRAYPPPLGAVARVKRVQPARVAVVIPCFNDGAFVGGAVASIREREPVECVVVDDGSTDPATREALAKLEADGVRVERRPNGGVGAARMTGVAATTAPYVFPLDADDEFEPGGLGLLADALDDAPEAAFAFGHLLLGHEPPRTFRPPPWDPFTLLYANRWTAACLFRRSVLESVGGWTFADCYEDWDLYLTLAERGYGGVSVDGLVVHYRSRDDRMNRGCHERHAEVYRLLRERHPALFARRAELARETGAPRWRQLAYPLLLGARPLYPFRVYYTVSKLRSRFG